MKTIGSQVDEICKWRSNSGLREDVIAAMASAVDTARAEMATQAKAIADDWADQPIPEGTDDELRHEMEYGKCVAKHISEEIGAALASKSAGAEQGNSDLLDACEFALESLTLEKDSYLGSEDLNGNRVIYTEDPYGNIKLAVARAKGCKVTGPVDGVYTVQPPIRDAVAEALGDEGDKEV